MSNDMKFCPYCGSELKSPDQVLCTSCGRQVAELKAPQVPVVAVKEEPSHIFAWIAALAVPVVGRILDYVLPARLSWISFVIAILLYGLFLGLDRVDLKEARIEVPFASWFIVLVPVYLWKRADVVHDKDRTHFWAWATIMYVLYFVIRF